VDSECPHGGIDQQQSAKATRRTIPVYRKLIYSIVPLVALLTVVEIICRLLPGEPPVAEPAFGFLIPDPDLLWRLQPRSDGPLATNELGLRDTSYNANADVKILLLGDSVSWGDGITDLRLCYPYELEQLLAAGDPSRTYEVINAGVPGYSTFQEGRYLQKYGLELNPKLVVLQFCLNDVVERYHTLAEYGGSPVFLGIDTRAGMTGPLGFAVRHSRAVELLLRSMQRRARHREAYEVELMARDKLSPELEEAWERTIAEIEAIRQITEQHNIPLLLVIAPYQFQLKDPLRLGQPQRRLTEYARSKNLPCFDLLPGFVEYARTGGLDTGVLFNDANHFSVFGHDAAAKLLRSPVQNILRSNRQ
jgi:lysophospholipase L1-like esterase